MFMAWLDYHRATLAWKCAGLTDEQLRERAVPPSSLSLLGLLGTWPRSSALVPAHPPRRRHPSAVLGRGQARRDFDDVDSADVASTSRASPTPARTRAPRRPARSPSTSSPSPPPEPVTLRWILVHMIEEYARHNGHADLLRERIDGAAATDGVEPSATDVVAAAPGGGRARAPRVPRIAS